MWLIPLLILLPVLLLPLLAWAVVAWTPAVSCAAAAASKAAFKKLGFRLDGESNNVQLCKGGNWIDAGLGRASCLAASCCCAHQT